MVEGPRQSGPQMEATLLNGLDYKGARGVPMGKRVAIIAFVLILIAAAGAALVTLAEQQSEEAKQRILDDLATRGQVMGPQPDTASPNWKQLSDELGVMLYTDQFGVRRATLFVWSTVRWEAVAVDGSNELGPDALPLGR